MLIASLGHAVVAVFDGDGSMMVFVPKLSSIRYEPLSTIVIDANGRVLRQASANDIINGGGGQDPYTGTYISNGSGTFRCASWIILKNTTADGIYCERYIFN